MKLIELYKRIILESNLKFIAYHNTTKNSYENIMNNGFEIKQNVRGSVYGTGIYFSKQIWPRWGDHSIKVQLIPQNPLIDLKGNITYEDNELGMKIQKLIPDHDMSNFKKVSMAIDEYMKINKHDLLLTLEHGQIIYVVKNPQIIKIIQ